MKKYVKKNIDNGLEFFENQQADRNGNSLDYPLVEIPEDYFENSAKYNFTGEFFQDIFDSDEYQAKILAEQKELRKNELAEQIKETDFKRIRAIAEPSVRQDGKSWLEYYNEQIIALRAEFNNL